MLLHQALEILAGHFRRFRSRRDIAPALRERPEKELFLEQADNMGAGRGENRADKGNGRCLGACIPLEVTENVREDDFSL